MRSLFAKLLVWFAATIAITASGIILTGALALSEPRSRRLPLNLLLDFQLNEARHAYETGGREALRETLARFASYGMPNPVLAGGDGRDLLTGQDRSDLAAALGKRTAAYSRRRVVMGRRDERGRYWYFLALPRRRWLSWFLQPEYLWIAGLVVLLCYAFAYHVTSPLRQMQKAVDCFRRGDFTARTGSRRKDELGQLARTLDQLAERIQTLLAAERRLLLDISHELRSPLARLGVAVELARSGPDREAALNRIQREADRLNALVGELLQVTRAEGDPAALRKEPVRLDELLGSIAEDCAFEAQARRCALRIESPAAVTVMGDAELLRRAAENVVRNAIRFEPEGSAVEICLREAKGSASVAVRDHGPGVPEEALARIFDPFYRVESDRNRASGGAGLGLAIAHRAVELHKGRIRARNAHPGLEIEIEIPLAALSERGL